MKRELINTSFSGDHLGCFGNFNKADKICKSFCILSLRCAIEQDQHAHYDLFEELLAFEEMPIKPQ